MPTRTAAVTAAAFVLVWSTIASAGPERPDHVSVRVYDTARLRPAVMNDALDGAAEIFRAVGVTVTWIPCSAREAADARCRVPLGDGEVAVRFVRLPPPAWQTGNVPLADSLIDRRLRSGVLATVYVDRVAAFAATSRTGVGVLLGRTVAHEIAHLLAGTDHHDASGLMRPVWTAQDLRRAPPSAWTLPAP